MRDIRILFDPASQALAVRRRLLVTIEPPSLRADPFGTSHDRRCRTGDRSCLLRSVDRLPLCLRCAVMGDAMIIFRLLTCRHRLLAAHGRLAQFAGALRPRARVRSGREHDRLPAQLANLYRRSRRLRRPAIQTVSQSARLARTAPPASASENIARKVSLVPMKALPAAAANVPAKITVSHKLKIVLAQ
jgi:hypothetical protein